MPIGDFPTSPYTTQIDPHHSPIDFLEMIIITTTSYPVNYDLLICQSTIVSLRHEILSPIRPSRHLHKVPSVVSMHLACLLQL